MTSSMPTTDMEDMQRIKAMTNRRKQMDSLKEQHQKFETFHRRRPLSLATLRQSRPTSAAELAVSRFLHDGTATWDASSVGSMRRSSGRSTPTSVKSSAHSEIISITPKGRSQAWKKAPPARTTSLPRVPQSSSPKQSPKHGESQPEEPKKSKTALSKAPTLSNDIYISTKIDFCHPESPAPDRAAVMARKYRLEFFEAKRLLKELDTFNDRTLGWPTFDDFCNLVCRAYEITSTDHIKEVELKRGYKDVCIDNDMSDDGFLSWYITNVFTFPQTAPSKNLHDVTLSLNGDLFTVEHLKKCFDQFADSSNSLDYTGFKKVMCSLLSAKAESDVAASRLKSIWKDMELKHGRINFEDFVEWYLTYVCPTADSEQQPDLALAESFYKSHAPPCLIPRRKQVTDMPRDYRSLGIFAGA